MTAFMLIYSIRAFERILLKIHQHSLSFSFGKVPLLMHKTFNESHKPTQSQTRIIATATANFINETSLAMKLSLMESITGCYYTI